MKLMLKVNQKGIAHLLLLVILAIGLGAGFLLVNNYGTQFINKAAPKIPGQPEASFELELEKSIETPFIDQDTPSSVGLGTKFRVDVYARSDNDEANLFAAKLKFPTDLLQVVEINKREGQTLVKNWVETFFDNSTGKISIVGGVPNPGLKTANASGNLEQSLLMASIIFEAKKVGDANLEFTDGSAVYRNTDNVNIISVKRDVAVSIKESQPAPSATSLESLTCNEMIANGAILGKNPSGEVEYIATGGKEVIFATNYEPLKKHPTVKWSASGGSFSLDVGADGGNNILTRWTAPKNETNDNQAYILKATLTNKEDAQETAICPDVKIVVKPEVGALAEASVSPSATPGTPPRRNGDINGDGKIDLVDFSAFLTDFGKEGPYLEADLDGDGRVSVIDYSKLLKILKDNGVIGGGNPSPSPSAIPGTDLGFTVSTSSIKVTVPQYELTNVFDFEGTRENVHYSIIGFTQDNSLTTIEMSPSGGGISKGFTTSVSMRVGKDTPLNVYQAIIRLKNTDNQKQLDIPATINVLPSVNYNQPVINSIEVTSAPNTSQFNVTIKGSGFNYNPTNDKNHPVYAGGIYRRLVFRDVRGITTSAISLPSENSLINGSWEDTVLVKKFVNRVSFLEAYVEVFFYSASGESVIATSNIKRVW